MPASSSPISIPAEAPVFAEPWEAEAFALAVSLNERGHFTWSEWAAALGREIAAAPARPYYQSWLQALETILAEKALVGETEREACAEAWQHAAHRTPHGEPIVLQKSDYPA